MWSNPADAPEPPPPPTARDQLITNVEDTIWAELERQAEIGMGPYIDREMGMVDASGADLNMTAVAAVVAALFVDSQDDCSWCHNPCAIDGWKQPLVDTDGLNVSPDYSARKGHDRRVGLQRRRRIEQ